MQSHQIVMSGPSRQLASTCHSYLCVCFMVEILWGNFKVSMFLRASYDEGPITESKKEASDLMKGSARTNRQKTEGGYVTLEQLFLQGNFMIASGDQIANSSRVLWSRECREFVF